MPAWNSSSLAVSDSSHNLKRHGRSGLLLNGAGRHSKQHMVEKKMFGSRFGKHGKDLQIGKKFKKIGKGIMKSRSMKSSSISPSVDEFDNMMKKSSSVTHNTSKKKSMFSRKQFG